MFLHDVFVHDDCLVGTVDEGWSARLWLDVDPTSRTAQRQFLWSFVSSIAGGTDEIQRNIVAERLFGLPRG